MPLGSPILVLAALGLAANGTQESSPLRPFAIGRGAPAATSEVASSFDWSVPAGASIFVDTVHDVIRGADGTTRVIEDGLIVVENVFIGAGARVRFRGPNPVNIVASGQVEIHGEVDVSGQDNLGHGHVLGTTRQPFPGARGQAGGGHGGSGSPQTQQSSARGGAGDGAFGRPRAGGGGGESSFHPTIKNARRGAGGGGGRFGPDVHFDFQGVEALCQTLVGLDAEPGFPGGPDGTGAVSGSRAQGGRLGLSPFQDASPDNDFFGVGRTPGGALVLGELERPWAGSGGGGGGDALRTDTFPNALFPSGEERGGGGGGGAGSLTIRASLGIIIGPAGTLRADGGVGGGGENTNFLDRVGGAGGGGSGGHIILQSMGRIRIDAVAAPTAGDGYDDGLFPGVLLEHPPRPISAVGGQGGVGKDNVGGASQGVPSVWKCDAIPLERLEVAGVTIPPLDQGCFQHGGLGDLPGAGGDGGPGSIQLHVPNPLTDLVFGGLADGDLTKVFAPRPVGWRDGIFELHLLPEIGTVASLHGAWMRLGARTEPEESPPSAPRLPPFRLPTWF